MKYLITLLLLFISISSKADDTPRTDSLWVNKSINNSNITYYHWYGDCEFVTETTPVRATKEAAQMNAKETMYYEMEKFLGIKTEIHNQCKYALYKLNLWP